jgi:hypothetical protein
MIEEIRVRAGKMGQDNARWRWGQCVFNATYELYPELADLYRGTVSDCFYRDDLVEEFLKQIQNHEKV